MHRIAVPLCVACLALVGCKAGAAANLIKGKDLTTKDAFKEAKCVEVPERGTPLVVDWESHARTDLEEAMHDGVAVVKYDCGQLTLLPDCHVDGNYGFMGSTTKSDLVSLAGSGEIKANLPTSGVKIVAELGRKSSLDVGLVQVGKMRSARRFAARDMLKGECEGATHFVRGAYVGAFALRSDTSGKVRAAVEVFGYGGGAGSEAKRQVVRRDGDPAACEAASKDAREAPEDCSSVLRLELMSIDAAAGLRKVSDDSAFVDCPRGLVEINGKCTVPDERTAHVCVSTDPRDCEAQCNAGDAQSCGRFGFMSHYGQHGLSMDVTKAAQFYEKGCNGEDPFSCAGLGVMFERGIGGKKQDLERAKSLDQRACEAGDPRGCNNWAGLLESGKGGEKDEVAALSLYERSCKGGWTAACANIGVLHEQGKAGLERNLVEANRRYQEACDLGDGGGCTNLGSSHFEGRGVSVDPRRATGLYQRGCDLGSGLGCSYLAAAYQSGDGGAVDPGKAAELLDRACTLGDAKGCHGLGEVKAAEDAKGASELFHRGCELGHGTACIALASMFATGVGIAEDAAAAERLWKKGCELGSEHCETGLPDPGRTGEVHSASERPSESFSPAPPASGAKPKKKKRDSQAHSPAPAGNSGID